MLAQCLENFTSSYGLPFSLFLGGLVGGFTHCSWMCSPFVVAQGQQKTFRGQLLIPYHLGRMTTYVFLAVIFSTVINLAFVFSDLKLMVTAPLLGIAGFVFIVSAFPKLLEIFPWVLRIKLGIPYSYIQGYVAKVSRIKGSVGRYGLGVLLGFMPCGLVISALMASASAPTVMQSAFAMSAFTLGTIPALALVSLGGVAFKYKYPVMSKYLFKGGMVVSGLWLFTLAGTMVF